MGHLVHSIGCTTHTRLTYWAACSGSEGMPFNELPFFVGLYPHLHIIVLICVHALYLYVHLYAYVCVQHI